MDIDLDTKDAVRRPPPPARRKRPSAIKCVVVLCSLIGLFVFATIAYFMGKGFYTVYDNARNPHKDLYLNSTVVEAGTEPVAWPFIDKDETFDVYFTIWARVPDSEVTITQEQKGAAKERFGGSWETIKKMTKMPDDELLVDPTERVVFSEKVFEGLGMKDTNVHKDISFELPLDRFRDKLVFSGDVRGSVVVIPQSDIWNRVEDFTGWKPEGVKSLGRLDDETIAQMGLEGLRRDLLDVTSVSFGMIELHDKNYLNDSRSDAESTPVEEEEKHDYFKDDLVLAEGDENEAMAKRYKRWETEQPHFVTKSHVYILDETRPLNRTAFDKKHRVLRDHACGLGLSLPPVRWLCSRLSVTQGVWEHRLVVEDTETGEGEVRYGPYINVLRHMSGPKHLIPLPVRRGKTFDEKIDKKTITVHHQITFSAFGSGRLHMLDSFVPDSSLDKNATEAQIMEEHNTWEQMSGVLGNRGQGTHPRTRFILGILEDFGLSFPIWILSVLYWYTRLTNAGIHSFSMYIIAGCIFFEFINFVYVGGKSKTVSWEMYVMALAMSGLELFQGWMIIKLVLPFELVWGDWFPRGIRRTGSTKRERITRRQEKSITWIQRGAMIIGMFAIFYLVNKYRLWVISPLHHTPNEHKDIDMSRHLASFLSSLKYVAVVLQLTLNHQARSFAGRYALETYLVSIRRIVRLLKFWPWFVGRYEARGGLGWGAVFWMAVEGVALWQALTLPRVEQVSSEDDDE